MVNAVLNGAQLYAERDNSMITNSESLQEYFKDVLHELSNHSPSPRLARFYAKKCAHYAFLVHPELREVTA
jgi:hypothetical protein